MSRGRRERLGFTLIELMVVVAIIAMLMGILLPSLSRARENGRRAACLSNLHHLGVAFANYFNDNDSILPDAAMMPSAGPNDPESADYHRPIMDYMMPYARDAELFRCPSDMPGKTPRLEPFQGKSFWETDKTSFEYTFIIQMLSEAVSTLGLRASVSVGDTHVKWAVPVPMPKEVRRFLSIRISELHLLKEFAPYHGKRGEQPIMHTLYADCHVGEHWQMWEWPEDPD
jgi:prepilin-type N-terminal cleavage/methylation domain-containing protein